MFFEEVVDPEVVDRYGLRYNVLVQACYEVLLVEHMCLYLKRLFRETAHDLGIDRVPCY